MALARQLSSATPVLLLWLLAAGAVSSSADYNGFSDREDYAPPKTGGGADDNGAPFPTTLPIYEKPPPYGHEVPPLTIAVEGVVSCKNGSKYSPLKGVVARIICLALNEKGNEAAPFSFSSFPTDEHGYFLATLSPSKLKGKAKVTQCKAFLPPSSPCEYCKYLTDINNGIAGALLRSFRILTNNKMKLYSVGPFFYTSQPNTL